MKKFKIFFRFDKEEKWLEYMESQGWRLSQKLFFYHFQRIVPEVRTVKIDYRIFKSEKDFVDYCTLFEDSGWRHITGTKSSGTQYFLKINEDSIEDIFSDTLSRAGRYKRFSDMWLFTAVVFMPLFVSMIIGGWINLDTLFRPKEWYLTPELWEMEGFSFWWSFLFETPFALLRGVSWIAVIIAILFFGGFAVKSWLLYNSTIASNKE